MIVVITPDNKRIVTTSSAVVFPEECVLIAEERGFATTTVGSVIAEQFGGDHAGPHASVTGGAVTRGMTLINALVIALRQIPQEN